MDSQSLRDQPGTGVLISGGDAWLRTGPGTQYDKAGVAKKGERFIHANPDNWVPERKDGKILWVSGKYAMAVASPAERRPAAVNPVDSNGEGGKQGLPVGLVAHCRRPIQRIERGIAAAGACANAQRLRCTEGEG